jgi:hypothetical protein
VRRLCLLLAVFVAAASIGTDCGETAVSPDQRSGGSQSGSHSSSTPKNDSKKAQHAALTDQKVSKKAQNASPSVPAVEEMSVFSRPRTKEDELPGSLSYLLRDDHCDDWLHSQDRCPGEAIADQSRLLLTELGVRKTSLYAWPTTAGWVCVAPDDGGASCTRDFRPGGRGTRTAYMGMDPDTDGVGEPGTLLGIVPDDVSAVTVKVGGVEHPAVVQNNGVFYELAHGSCSFWAFESLTTTYRDGTSDTVPIHWRNGGRMPETCEV